MKTFLRLLVLIPLLFISSCTKKSNPVEPSSPTTPTSGGKISTGENVDVGGQTIGTSGGSFTVNRPGDPLNGFQIIVPANGFAQAQSFSVSYAPITYHQLGSYINPVSPLITITYGGGYSADEMKVKVPIKLPKGCFAMGFLYDATTGNLEPLPLSALDSASVTIATRHLSPSDVQLGKRLMKSANLASGTIFISYILLSVLGGQSVLSTGFTPGVDDWEFPNNGSYIAPNGHCVGQCASAIWYYYNKKLKGSPGLFHQFDKIADPMKPDSAWFDNPNGYRFASTVHADINQDYAALKMYLESWVPDVVFDSFVYSMLVTGMPQMVFVRNSAGQGGHALIVYKIDVLGGRLYVADPNYPNNRDPQHNGAPVVRAIEYVPGYITGSFKPYSISAKVGDPTILCDQIAYAAVTAYVDWGKIAQRWGEFENKKVGNDRFPTYTLLDIQNSHQIADAYDTDVDSLRAICSSQCAFSLHSIPNRQLVNGYNEWGSLISQGNDLGILTLSLKPGDNTFGFHMQGIAADTQWHYLDYTLMKIHRHMTLTIATTEANGAPVSISGMRDKPYTFIAKSAKPVPKDGKVRYDWNFNDGSPVSSVNNDSSVTHSFLQEGTFTIDVGFYYDLTKINNVTRSVTISPRAPVISSMVPNTAWVGDTVKIKGKYFGADKTKGTVTFSSGVAATQIIIWNDTAISVKVPQGTQTGPTTVTVNGLTSNAVTFTIPTAVSDLLAVAGGSFQMGQSPGPIGQSPGHAVTVGAFKIDKYEITYEKWTEVRNWGLTHGYTDLTSAQNGAAPTGANNPVTMVSWYQIMRWCNARSEKDGMTPVYYTSSSLTTVYRTGVLDVAADQVKWTANGYRLPTEAEWEFVARGGKTGTNVYSGSNTLGDVAWFHDNAGNHTHQVGTKSPNELGTYDMTGNVYEWCWDFYGEYATGAQTDPKGPTTGVNRIVRGGSYIDYDYGCPLVARYSEYPSTTAPILGFRCVQH